MLAENGEISPFGGLAGSVDLTGIGEGDWSVRIYTPGGVWACGKNNGEKNQFEDQHIL